MPQQAMTNFLKGSTKTETIADPPQKKRKAELTVADKEAKRKEKEEGQRAKKAKKDPNAPKKPMASFFFFCQEKRAEYRKEHPDVTFGEVGKALGELWKQLTAEEKAPFEKQAAQDKQRYEKEMQSYTPPMRDASNGGDAKPQKKSKAKKDPNAPKRGMTSFFLFSNDMRAKVKNEGGGLKASEIVTKLAEMWKEADKETKEKYEKLAAADRDRYAKQMAAYKKGEAPAKAADSDNEADDVAKDEAEDDAEDSAEDSAGDDSEDEKEAVSKNTKKKKVVADDDDDDEE
jgi:hypothetical protein|uniref:HMG box domain-containing protein n=1 Tax=Eutreptiella gymnastica TaxID=73025 RepID=A0A7S4D1B1_9EUGL